MSFRNDYLAICQEVYKYDDSGKRTHVVPSLKRELRDFATTWFANLKEQGFFTLEARREILE